MSSEKAKLIFLRQHFILYQVFCTFGFPRSQHPNDLPVVFLNWPKDPNDTVEKIQKLTHNSRDNSQHCIGKLLTKIVHIATDLEFALWYKRNNFHGIRNVIIDSFEAAILNSSIRDEPQPQRPPRAGDYRRKLWATIFVYQFWVSLVSVTDLKWKWSILY